MEFLKTVFYFLIVIGVMVVIHEWGHYIAARLSGIRADIFSFGMGKRLFGWHRKTGFSFGELPEDYDYGETTDWRVSFLPMGGYVKVAGMVDESFDTEFANKTPEPWEFRSKNLLQKSFVLVAGVVMNFILAIAIFAGINYFKGEQIIRNTEIGYVKPNSIGEKIGFKEGDKVLKINSKQINSFDDIIKSLTISEFGQDKNIAIIRAGSNTTLNVSGSVVIKKMQENSKEATLGFYPSQVKVIVQEVEKNKPAANAGFLTNDTILTVNNATIPSFTVFTENLKTNIGKSVDVNIKRGSNTLTLKVTPNESGKIGVALGEKYTGKYEIRDFGLFESISLGYNQSVDVINLIIGSFAQIFKGNVKFNEAVAGPIMIAKQSSKSADMGLEPFLRFMAMISISLAVMNILPFPALDGGHLVFVIIESIIRREIPIKVKLYIQNIGMGILMLFFAYVIIMDILKLV
jgi:regulator of sigma E protease